MLLKLVFAQDDSQMPIMRREGYGLGKAIKAENVQVNEIEKQFGQGVSQVVELEIVSGAGVGKKVTVDYTAQDEGQRVMVGDLYIVAQAKVDKEEIYNIVDRYRIYPLVILTLVFIFLVIFLAKLKGLGSLFGFAATLFVLLYFIAPNLLAGHSPVVVASMGCAIIASLSMFLSHGISRRTGLAYLSTLILLGLSVGLSALFVNIARLSGAGTEEAFLVSSSSVNVLNLKGVLLAGIIIGIMGVLDDITTAQTAAVDEIHRANPSLKGRELYKRGLSVGREHIASLVNTLMLAYAGSSLPLFLLLNLNSSNQPLWVTLNSEMMAEEIVRTLVGSTVLVLTVPIATFIAAVGVSRRK